MGKDLYRTRLKKSLKSDVLGFLSSLKDDLWIAEEDVVGTEVHNIMLFEQGILNQNEVKQILQSLEKIKSKINNDELDLNKNFEDIHPFIEKSVIDDIGIEIGGKIHTGRSRNDQVSVDIRLKIRDNLNHLSKDLIKLSEVLINFSKKSIDIYMPLYTHLQRAQLGVLSHYINNYIAQILRSLERIEEIYKRINMNPLGACAIGGTSININVKRTAELLGFETIFNNSIDAISSKDYIYETLTCLALISIQFSRIAEDLIIWTTKEFEFFELDDEYCSVSSVMPQKKNPDTLELIRSKSSKIISNLSTASMIIKAIPSGYFRDFQDLKMLIKESFDLLFSIINIFNGVFTTIKVNRDILINTLKNSYIQALDLAEYLVCEYNIPFRQSHRIIATLIKEFKNPQDIFKNENLEKIIFDVEKKEINLPEYFMESLKDFNFWLEKRNSHGSPSKMQVEKTIKDLNLKKETLYKSYLARVEKTQNAKDLRENIIRKLIA